MMFKCRVTMPASVLASVLVVSTLMFIGLLLAISLWNSELLLMSEFHRYYQEKADIGSAVVRYCQDTLLASSFQNDTSLKLYPDISSGEVRFERFRWGLYEMVGITAGQQKRWYLTGKANESFFRAALYIPGKQSMLSLSGKTCIEGKLYLGERGLTYSQVRSEFFNGHPVESSQIGRSKEKFPSWEPGILEYVGEILDSEGDECPLPEMQGERSFGDGLAMRRVEGGIRGTNLRGHYMLWARDSVYIDGDCRLQGVLIVARKIRIGEGFRGSVQVFARDSIVVEKRVILTAGSGLWVDGALPGRCIRLGEGGVVNGYIVVGGNAERAVPRQANFYQPFGAGVKGLVYVEGVAHIRGNIEGSLYAEEVCDFAPEGYYSGLLYGATLSRSPGTVYPFLMQGPQERRVIK